MDELTKEMIARKLRAASAGGPLGAAVVVPLLPGPDGFDILFELRADDIDIQPGEVCLPGGHIEPGETPEQAVLREVEEELHVSREQLELLGELDSSMLAHGAPFHAFVGVLHDYEGSFDTAEVARTFTIPLSWFMEHEPAVWRAQAHVELPDDLPFERIPGGRDYPWRPLGYDVPFYLETDPLVWGLTARVLGRLVEVLR